MSSLSVSLVWEIWARCTPGGSAKLDGGKFPAVEFRWAWYNYGKPPPFLQSPSIMMTWVHLARCIVSSRLTTILVPGWQLAFYDEKSQLPYFIFVWINPKVLRFCFTLCRGILKTDDISIATKQTLLTSKLPNTYVLILLGRVNACDREEKYETLKEEWADRVNTQCTDSLVAAHAEISIETSCNSSEWSSRLQSKWLYYL